MTNDSYFYSFDDLSIGKTRDNNHLFTKEILRPKGLSNKERYKLAASTVKIINTAILSDITKEKE